MCSGRALVLSTNTFHVHCRADRFNLTTCSRRSSESGQSHDDEHAEPEAAAASSSSASLADLVSRVQASRRRGRLNASTSAQLVKPLRRQRHSGHGPASDSVARDSVTPLSPTAAAAAAEAPQSPSQSSDTIVIASPQAAGARSDSGADFFFSVLLEN